MSYPIEISYLPIWLKPVGPTLSGIVAFWCLWCLPEMVVKRKKPPAGDPVPKTPHPKKPLKLTRVGFPLPKGCQEVVIPLPDVEGAELRRCGISVRHGSVETGNRSSAAAAGEPLQQAAVAAVAAVAAEGVEAAARKIAAAAEVIAKEAGVVALSSEKAAVAAEIVIEAGLQVSKAAQKWILAGESLVQAGQALRMMTRPPPQPHHNNLDQQPPQA